MATVASPVCATLQQQHCRSPSLGLPGIFELVEAAEVTSAAQEALESQLLQPEARKEQPLDWSDLYVAQTEQCTPALELPSAPMPVTDVPAVRVAKAVAAVESQQECAQKLKEQAEILQLVGTQARLIEELEADIETLRTALRQQSLEAADSISKATFAASLGSSFTGGSAMPACPDTPPSAPAGSLRAGGATSRAVLMRQLLQEGTSTDSGTDEDESSVGEGTEDGSSLVSSRSRQSLAVELGAMLEQEAGQGVVCATDFASHAAVVEVSPSKAVVAAAVDGMHAPRCAVQPSAFSAAAVQPFPQESHTPSTPVTKPQPVRPRPAFRRQLSAADVAAFGSMGLTFSIAPPSPTASDVAPSVASMDENDTIVPCGPRDSGDEFLEPVGCLVRPWRSESAPQHALSLGSYTPFQAATGQLSPAQGSSASPASAQEHWRRRSEDGCSGGGSGPKGRDVVPDVLAQRLASYRSVKESTGGCGAHGKGSWQVPVVVVQQRTEVAKEEDPLEGTLLGAVYKLFSG